MNKLIWLIPVLIIFLKWGDITTYFNPALEISAASSGDVILYATDWCRYCRQARAFMQKNNIPYYEYDIEKSTRGKDEYDRLGGGGVPLILINGEVIRGYSPNMILELVGRN